MKQVRIYYELADGSRRTQTLPAVDGATKEQIENVVKNNIKNITTRTIVESFMIDYTELNLE